MSYVETKSIVNVVSALQKMRSGVILFFVAWALADIGVIVALALLLTILETLRDLLSMTGLLAIFIGAAFTEAIRAGMLIIIAAIGAGMLIIIGCIIALIGFYSSFVPGVRDLANANPEFSTASSLIRIGYIWGLILTIIGVILVILIIGIPILFIGAIFLLIGHIGIIVLCFKLDNVYQNLLYLVAGVFFILSIFLPISGIIGWILIYIALGDTIRKLQTQVTPGMIQV